MEQKDEAGRCEAETKRGAAKVKQERLERNTESRNVLGQYCWHVAPIQGLPGRLVVESPTLKSESKSQSPKNGIRVRVASPSTAHLLPGSLHYSSKLSQQLIDRPIVELQDVNLKLHRLT